MTKDDVRIFIISGLIALILIGAVAGAAWVDYGWKGAICAMTLAVILICGWLGMAVGDEPDGFGN